MNKESVRGYYVRVYGFMLDVLGLSGSSLLVFALIYSFSCDGVGRFCGSREYITAVTGVAGRTVSRELSRLCERGLVVRQREASGFYTYAVSPELIYAHEKYIPDDPCQNVGAVGQNVGAPSQNGARGSQNGNVGSQNGRSDTPNWQGDSAKMATNKREDNKAYNKAYKKEIPHARERKEKEVNSFSGSAKRCYGSSYPVDSPEHKAWVQEAFAAALSRSFEPD